MTPARLRDLMARARRGEDAAFEALVVATRDRLFCAARRLLGRDALAEETLQEAYVALWSQPGEPPLNPEAWLRTAVVNRSLDHLRREEHRRTARWEEAEPTAASGAPDPLELAGASEVSSAVLAALDQIPPGERAVFVLRAFEEWPFEQIAARAGVRDSTARNQYLCARRRLAKVLREKGMTP